MYKDIKKKTKKEVNEIDKLLSIIVPMYNVEKYIRRCLQSIQKQGYSNFECLVIDDGSTDNGACIVKDFCRVDSRFSYTYKENGGVSAARNLGISLAKGDAIGFVDADDKVTTDMYCRMMSYLDETDADMVFCDVMSVHRDGKTQLWTFKTLEKTCCMAKRGITSGMLYEMAGACCRGIYKRDLVKEIVVFPHGLKLSEDAIFNLWALGESNRIGYIKEPLYYQYVRMGSAVNRHYDNLFEIMLEIHHKRSEVLRRLWPEEEYLNVYDDRFIQDCYNAINSILSFKQKKTLLQKYYEMIEVCENDELQEALDHAIHTDRRISWMKEKKYICLAVYTVLANVKNHR